MENGRYVNNNVGNVIRSDWRRFYLVWQKTTGGDAADVRRGSMSFSIFYFKRIPSGDYGNRFDGVTIFCENLN